MKAAALLNPREVLTGAIQQVVARSQVPGPGAGDEVIDFLANATERIQGNAAPPLGMRKRQFTKQELAQRKVFRQAPRPTGQ